MVAMQGNQVFGLLCCGLSSAKSREDLERVNGVL